jgi:hypothetical protein
VIRKPKYCYVCGKPLKEALQASGFDPVTGLKTQEHTLICPDYSPILTLVRHAKYYRSYVLGIISVWNEAVW